MRKLIVIALVVAVVAAGVWYVTADDTVYELEVTLYSRSSATDVYRADMDLTPQEKGLMDYIKSTSDTNFPDGSNELSLKVWTIPNVNANKDNPEARKILDKTWDVGDLYGEQLDNQQEWVFTANLPDPGDDDTVYIQAKVYYNGQEIGTYKTYIDTTTGNVG